MTVSNKLKISALYAAVFSRAPDKNGLDFWLSQAASSNNVFLDIANGFVQHPVYKQVYDGLSNAAFVNALYVNILGGAGDAGGVAYWTGLLTTQSRALVLSSFVQSSLEINLTAGSPAATSLSAADLAAAVIRQNTITNKASVGVSFAELLGTASNLAATTNPATLAGLQSDAAYNASVEAIKNVTHVKSTADSAVANLQAAQASGNPIAYLTNASSNAGQTFTLTTSIDTITGTSANDTFNSINEFDQSFFFYGGQISQPTLSTLDTLDGGLGVDTLNIADTTFINTTNLVGVSISSIEIANLTSANSINTNTTTWAGLETLNLKAVGTTDATAAATTDVNALTSIAATTINGGKNVTINHAPTTDLNVTATATAGLLDITSAKGNVIVGDVSITATPTTNAKGAVNVKMTAKAAADAGTVVIDGGTTFNVTATGALTLAQRTANAAAKTASVAAEVATAAADAKADTLVSALATMTGVITQTTPTVALVNDATLTALKAGNITQAQKVAIDAAFATGLVTDIAAAKAAALVVYKPIVDAAAAAVVITAAAENAAIAADAAQDVIAAANQLVAQAVDNFNVTAINNTALTSASITGNAGATNSITDASTNNNTLTTVNLNNAGITTITGKAVATVNLVDQLGQVDVVNATTANTLALNLNNVTTSIITSAGDTTTINLTAVGKNAITLTAADTKALNITGAGSLSFAANPGKADAVINASTATGDITTAVALGQTYTGGSGVDTITTDASAHTKAVSGGAGTADKLIIINAANSAATPSALFTGFEILQAKGAAVNAALFTGSTITAIELAGTGAAISGLTAAQALNVKAIDSHTLNVGITGASTIGQLDVLRLTADDGTSSVSTIALATPVLTGIETLNLVANDNVTITALTSATSISNINVTGAATVGIITDALSLNANTTINASAATGAFTFNAAAALVNGISITGSATAANTLTGSAQANVLVGGAGNDSITGGIGNDTITAGEGNNTIITGDGVNTVTAGNGHNTVTGGAGVDTITLGNGFNTVVAGDGNDIIVVGTGGNVITGGIGADTITLGAGSGASAIIYTVAGQTASAATAPTIVSGTYALTGIDKVSGLQIGDTIDLSGIVNTLTGTVATTIAGATGNTVSLVRGNFATATNIFTTSATGTDTLVVYDINGAVANDVVEAVALIGVNAAGTVAAGVLTLTAV